MTLLNKCIHLIIMILLLILFPLASFLHVLYGEGVPTNIEINVFIGIAILIVVLSFAKRLLGGTNSMVFVCSYSFLFLIFWIGTLADSVNYERSQTLDLIRFIGFTTSLISTLFLLKINQFRLSDHHK